MNVALLRDLEIHRVQRLSQTRAQQAAPTRNVELGTVRVADDARPIAIQIGVTSPRQSCAFVRTAIAVRVELMASPYDEQRVLAFLARLETAGRSVREVLE